MSQSDVDLTQVTPEQFAELVAGATDEEIAQLIHAVGVEQVLDRIFEGMQERFVPSKAQGVTAVMQFDVTDEGDTHSYAVSIADGSCSIDRGAADAPRVTIITGLVPFVKLVSGTAEGPQLFMTGKLKVTGDLMFSMQIMSFFDRPTAG